jgi:L-threonylcarbamoyladenylate synthase
MSTLTDPTATRPTLKLTANAADLARAVALVREGGILAFPTETVYGLGASALRAESVARIFAAKGRPLFNPLIAHLPSLAAALQQGAFNSHARALAEAFWPGPLTLVVPLTARTQSCDLARAGLNTIALRVPRHPLALALLEACEVPLVAPSANRSGHVSPTSAAHVLADMEGRIDAVIDGGPTQVGVESTIIACLDETPRLLRAGGIAIADIEHILHCPVKRELAPNNSSPLAPGMLSSHYAPRAPLRLNARGVFTDEAVLDFGNRFPDALLRLDLSARGDVVEAAAHLYDYLRRLDAQGAKMIAVAPIPSDGLGEAMNDRLMRAAAPR